MKVTITSLHLRRPWHFFPLSLYAMRILKQLKATNCKEVKTRGVGSIHYTLTLWDSDQELKQFARSGEHLEAMKKSRKISREIRIHTYDADALPSWAEAKRLLVEEGRLLSY